MELLGYKVLELLKYFSRLNSDPNRDRVPLPAQHGIWVAKFTKTAKVLAKMEEVK